MSCSAICFILSACLVALVSEEPGSLVNQVYNIDTVTKWQQFDSDLISSHLSI